MSGASDKARFMLDGLSLDTLLAIAQQLREAFLMIANINI